MSGLTTEQKTRQLQSTGSWNATPTGLLQRKCDCGQHTIGGRECEGCTSERERNTFRRSAVNSDPMDQMSFIVNDVPVPLGRALEKESSDFSHVRLKSALDNEETASSANVSEPAKRRPGTERLRQRVRRGNCNYTLETSREENMPRPSGLCGAGLMVTPVRVIARGRGCPPLDGVVMTEDVVPVPLRSGEQPCGTDLVQQGGGCPMDANGFFVPLDDHPCVDEYFIWGGIGRFPQGTCTRRFRQRYLIGDTVIAVNHIVFRVTRNTSRVDNQFEIRTRDTCSAEPVDFQRDRRTVVV